MSAKRCPKCGLVNPGSADRCDCGRSFVDGTQGQTLGERIDAKRGGDANREDRRAERDTAIRRARNWILAVGLLIFVVDQITINVVYGALLPADWKVRFLFIDTAILGFFVAMFIVARTKPLGACIAALCGFWAMHIILAIINPGSLFQGLIIKALFTMALIRAIQQASAAQRLVDELGEVFS